MEPSLLIARAEQSIALKMSALNDLGVAVIYAVTGGNGTGKTHLSKQLLTRVPFHQSFNLGTVTKTIRCLSEENEVTILENFKNKNIETLFSHIIQFAAQEYQKNGVNILIDGVQIDTPLLQSDQNILGGVILDVSETIKLQRNDKPSTHFKRTLAIHAQTDVRQYVQNDKYVIIHNDGDFDETYLGVLGHLELLLDKKLAEVKSGE